MIPYGRQDISQSDIDAVVDVLRSDFVTQGPVVPRFEQAVASRVKANHAVAVNSGTSALHVACHGLRLGKGDSLWTVPNTFVASANCARYCGADVDFVDIDPDTWNLSVPQLRDKLLLAKKEDRLPKVVVPVHFAGQPTEQEAIWELSEEFGFKILEDASHAIGASRNGEPVGSCRWSHVTVFSFHPVKVITSGEGGMALTNDDEIAARMTMFRSHGITRDATRLRGDVHADEKSDATEKNFPAWYYEQQMLGFNYRMTDIHAALGLNQLARLEDYIERRNALAEQYSIAFEGSPLHLPSVEPANRSAYHLYVVRLTGNATVENHRQVFDQLREMGIAVNLHYIPVHLQPYYRELGFKPGQFPEAEAYGRTAITLPLFPRLTESMQEQVVTSVETALGCLA
jgi:UDP-4-amino-4,6-dideoxy-N-acetyl-beta-L-altrosamine transaminase